MFVKQFLFDSKRLLFGNQKSELINNEINRKVKNYSINKSDLNTYYTVGKLLFEAGKHYGESIIKEYLFNILLSTNKFF